MATKTVKIARLSEMTPGEEADLFVLLSAKESLTTRDSKPYFRVTFRDAAREVGTPIWADSEHFEACQKDWAVGRFYKVRATYRETNYGPQLDIRRVREVVEADAADGFDPWSLVPQSRFDREEMFRELVDLAENHIANAALRELVLTILEENRAGLINLPAATRNHHSFAGGWTEHVVSVTRTAVFLADKYHNYYPDLVPPLDKGLVVAGAILHDIGKVRELELLPEGPAYTASGSLIGHILQGRDIVREAAARLPLEPDTLLRLEHIIVSHQRLPEWGSPKPPMTPEALLVHFADDIDAKFNMVYTALRDDPGDGAFTSKRNVLTQQFYRGQPLAEGDGVGPK